MKARDLFTIILKIFGIYLIKDILFAIPKVFYYIIQFAQNSLEEGIFAFFASLLSLAFSVLIVYILVFRTDLVVSKLKLTKGVSEEPLLIDLHRSSVYTIAIIITGILILVFSVPELVKELYYWIEYIDSKNRFFASNPFDYTNLLTIIAQVILGMLLLNNQRNIVNFIERRRRDAVLES
jgi:RsiW-degrading membrane proteinase PrsW (M82 family)